MTSCVTPRCPELPVEAGLVERAPGPLGDEDVVGVRAQVRGEFGPVIGTLPCGSPGASGIRAAGRAPGDIDQDDRQGALAECLGEGRGAIQEGGDAGAPGAEDSLLEVDEHECGNGVECGQRHVFSP
ncbi:MAG: hypothetical protein LKI24_17715 [Acidipropionibacterium sp.]|jgi:hypothetical protein|nr:hypothetical protein [Acidipropionibacterium sp.]